MNTPTLTRNHSTIQGIATRRTTGTVFVLALTIFAAMTWVTDAAVIGGEPSVISFDLPPTTVAVPVTGTGDLLTSDVAEPIEISLRLSSLVSGATFPEIDRWMIRCVPRSSSWRVVNYSPRTETQSDYTGPIQVKKSDEDSQSFGMAIDAAQGHLARGHFGVDQGSKQTESLQYERHAPLHAVTAAGTIERGRGVYYKLRWTSTQVLEGEKEFKITFDVPAGFRAGLVDISVVAIGRPGKKNAVTDAFAQIPVLGDEAGAMRPLGAARFVVAVHAEGDPVARQAAQAFSDSEATLRREAGRVRATSPARSLSTLIRHVVAKLDVDSVDVHGDWAERLIFNQADPYTDPIIRKLPTETRVIALDFCDAQRSLETLQTRTSQAQATQFELNDLVQASIDQVSK